MKHLVKKKTEKSMKKSALRSVLLLAAMCLSALTAGCALKGPHKGTRELTENMSREKVETVDIMEPSYESVNPRKELTEFSLELLSKNLSHDNCLISPLSIVSALGMTANGAKGSTRAQMEQMMHTDTAVLNDYLKAYTDYMPNSEAYKVNIANSIWFRDSDSLTKNEDFLKTSRTYYDASIFEAPFDTGTRDDINNWVKKETNGMIEKLLEDAPNRDAVMYLVNALSFDGQWRDIYEKNQIHKGTFNAENGEQQSAEFMYSAEAVYLENAYGTGFIKPYADSAYAFAAVLPNEGMQMEDFLEKLKEGGLTELLEQTTNQTIHARIPIFSVEYNVILNESLMESGMKDAFDSRNADFSAMARSDNDNIYISKVIHKTKIDVDAKGTKAGAVTAVEVSEGSAVQTEEPKKVYLDRPFFYMIIDTRQNFPLFMGCLMQME